jgi:DMSO/TMAO reductase YedYZ molybdopterin-dependent catalytic subunit
MPSASPSPTLRVGGPCAARELDLDAAALAALPARHQVPDVGALLRGRAGKAVRLQALSELAGAGPDARIVHVASSDGGFTANLALERALDQGLLLYAQDGAPLPARLGGPFRLLLADGSGDCSVNVKFLGQVLFLAEPGSHTARCADEPG